MTKCLRNLLSMYTLVLDNQTSLSGERGVLFIQGCFKALIKSNI